MKFCKVRRGLLLNMRSKLTDLDLVPFVVVQLQGAETVLLRNDQAVARDELFRQGTRKVCPGAQSHDRSERIPVILPTEGTVV